MSAVLAHIAVGTFALALYWSALLRRKGSPAHKRAGRLFLAGLGAVALSVGPLILTRAATFDPGDLLKFVYLDLCLVTAGWLLFRAIHLRRAPERFRSRAFLLLGLLLLAFGFGVLAAGLVKGEPLTAFFSWIGLVLGTGVVVFARRTGPLHPNWWLSWHLNAAALLFDAVHGTLLFVLWRWLVAPDAAGTAQIVIHVATLLAAAALRLALGRRFGAPLRFGPERRKFAAKVASATTRT